MTHRLLITNICAKLFQIPSINDKVMDRTRKCDGRTDRWKDEQTDGAYFYIPLFSSKRRGTINTLQQENDDLKATNLALTRTDVLELRADAADQYSRLDSLRITGTSENKDENTDQIILDMSSSIGTDLSLDEIALSHRFGYPRSSFSENLAIS
jgi:hypothetical protein